MNIRAVEIPGVELGPELGHGAHSVVYRAVRRGAPCAVKVPRSRGRWTQSVYREAVALARVRDPALPNVLEVGEHDGLPYLVMELVEGETLAQHLRRGPMSESRVIELGLALASALGSVHDAGLVHRDVKPRNLVLDSRGTARLVDFGFASPIERGADRSSAGTPGYSAPEQLRAPAVVDGRADLYALGRVLFECLSGRLPESALEPDASPARELGQLGVSAELAEVVAGLLPREPGDRYPDARVLSADLEAVRMHRPVAGPGPRRGQRCRPPMVGRESELSRLKRAISRVGDAGGVAILLSGVAGSGKTRLLREALAWHTSRDAFGVEAHAEQGDPPLALLRRVIEAHLAAARDMPSPDRERRENAFRQACAGPLARVASLIAPQPVDVVGSSPSTPMAGSEELEESAAELLVRWIAREGPLLLLVDDMHWADSVSRDVLLRLAHRIDEAPLAMVLATRAGSAPDAVSEVFRDVRSDRWESITLGTLDRSEVAVLVAKHLGGPAAEPEVVRRVAALADGTPLGVLEVLGAFLDEGALRPHDGGWQLDAARAERVALPKGAHAMLGHRVQGLPPATRRVLQVAATLGTTFDESLLARVVGMELNDLRYGLVEAWRAGLIQVGRPGAHGFVHHTLRESLLATMSEAERRAAHQHIAEVLDESEDATVESCFAMALHYAHGDVEKAPRAAARAARAAAEASLERSDNETTLQFLGFARAAAERAGDELDLDFHRTAGEAHLRQGNLGHSLSAFESALEHAPYGAARGELFGRIAWVHQAAADPDRAWRALEHAFEQIAMPMPAESLASVRHTLVQVGRRGLRAIASKRSSHEPSPELLALRCQLLYQNARLGLEYGKPLRLVQSTLQTLEESDRLGESAALARARAMYGLVLTAIGRKRAGARTLEDAVHIAERAADPITTAFATQLSALGACFAGEFDRAEKSYRECFEAHGPWLELSEFCLSVGNAELIDALRGRPDASWRWMERAIARVRRSRQTIAAFDDYVLHRARAALATLGRELSTEPWLHARFETNQSQPASPKGFLYLLSWGARVRCFVECGNLGPDFEALVAEFEAEGHNPRSVHPAVVEYYIAVAHARLHQCLTAPDGERLERLPALKKALVDLRASARLPLFELHRVYIEACIAWLDGSPSKARELLAGVVRRAEEQSCPWVLYGVARLRAHMLRAEGLHDSACDQARVADALASSHGAEPRARWIREEFGIEPVRSPATTRSVRSSHGSSSRSSHQLDAVLHVVRAGARDLHPELTAESVLDQLIREVDADRGAVWFHPDVDSRPQILIGRTGRGGSSFEVDAQHQALLRRVRDEADDWTPGEWGAETLGAAGTAGADQLIGMALFLRERAVGSVVLERGPAKPPFSPDEHALLGVLVQQVPLALEIPRLLADRDQLQASLQHAQKMDAVGQLAGGVAHDFNNMLTIVQSSVERLEQLLEDDDEGREELKVLSETIMRAGELTRQLLTFSRHRPLSEGPCSINDVLSQLEPMLRRLVGRSVELSVTLSPELHRVDTDRSAFEQAIINLAGNARDAMPRGGSLEIAAENVTLDDQAIPHRPESAGDYVCIVVRDTGLGMSAELQSRVFEPFFTTKPSGSGTGLGLATVYSFTHSSEGHVEISSEEGSGSEFRLYLPRGRSDVVRSEGTRTSPHVSPDAATPEAAPAILVVDDEAAIARSIRRTLKLEGYEVLIADDGAHALRLMGEHGSRIALVIIDVLMPDMRGPELAARIAETGALARVLFMSGYAPNELGARQVSIERDAFMEKPFSQADLIGKVQRLLEA